MGTVSRICPPMKSITCRSLRLTFAAVFTLCLACDPISTHGAIWNGPGLTGVWDTSATNWTGTIGVPPWDSVNGNSNNANFSTSGNTANVSGAVFAGTTVLGSAVGATGNTLNVAGGATVTSNVGNARLNVGDVAGGNSVVISTPGTSGTPSYSLGGSSNQVNVGISSSSNSLTVQGGAYLRVISGGGTNTWTIGTNAGANNNSILVTGVGSTIDRISAGGSSINVGATGDGNSMTLSAGGTVIPRRLGIGTNGGKNNFVRVTGVGSTLNFNGGAQAILQIGLTNGSTGNYLQIDNGGTFTGTTNENRGYVVGAVAGADNNYILVDGVGSTFTLLEGMPLSLGGTAGVNNASHVITDSTASGNHFDIFNGALSVQNTVYLLGVNSSINLGNGVGVSVLEVRHSNGNAIYGAGVVLSKADSRLNINEGRLNAGTIGGTSTNLVSGPGQVNLIGNGYFNQNDTTFTRTISSQITGSGDFHKEGAGELTLTSALNNYVGDTYVDNGILTLTNAFLDNASDVYISATGELNLTHGSIDVIGALSINGIFQAPGTYGATGSGATFINDAAFSGTGQVQVSSLGGGGPGPVAVPEPASLALWGLLGLGMFAALRRRRTAA